MSANEKPRLPKGQQNMRPFILSDNSEEEEEYFAAEGLEYGNEHIESIVRELGFEETVDYIDSQQKTIASQQKTIKSLQSKLNAANDMISDLESRVQESDRRIKLLVRKIGEKEDDNIQLYRKLDMIHMLVQVMESAKDDKELTDSFLPIFLKKAREFLNSHRLSSNVVEINADSIDNILRDIKKRINRTAQ